MSKLTREQVIEKYHDEILGLIIRNWMNDDKREGFLGRIFRGSMARIDEILGEAYDKATGTSLGNPPASELTPVRPPPSPPVQSPPAPAPRPGTPGPQQRK